MMAKCPCCNSESIKEITSGGKTLEYEYDCGSVQTRNNFTHSEECIRKIMTLPWEIIKIDWEYHYKDYNLNYNICGNHWVLMSISGGYTIKNLGYGGELKKRMLVAEEIIKINETKYYLKLQNILFFLEQFPPFHSKFKEIINNKNVLFGLNKEEYSQLSDALMYALKLNILKEIENNK